MDKFKVELEAKDWQSILNYLARAPYSEVAPLIARISQQLAASSPQEVPGNGSTNKSLGPSNPTPGP